MKRNRNKYAALLASAILASATSACVSTFDVSCTRLPDGRYHCQGGGDTLPDPATLPTVH